jgi:hypothetical protein
MPVHDFDGETVRKQAETNPLTPGSEVVAEKLTVCSASQEITRFLWNPKFHYRAHKSPPPVPILSQMNPAQNLSPYFPTIIIIVIFPFRPRSSGYFLNCRLSNQNFMCTSHFPLALYVPPILLVFIMIIIFDKECELWSSSICKLIQKEAEEIRQMVMEEFLNGSCENSA